MINKFDLLCVSNFIELGLYFIFGTKFFWNEGIDTCFDVECVLFGRNCDLLSGYLVVTTGCCLLLDGYWWLLLVIGGYCSLPLVTACSQF